VLLARALVRAGYTVCIVDADSTNMGLNKALGITKSPASLIEYFGGMIFGGGLVTCPVDDPTPAQPARVTVKEPRRVQVLLASATELAQEVLG
jgi:CO dehydrogenase nickel-insertion accessory protein CooC1